jgi:hypothetical protein
MSASAISLTTIFVIVALGAAIGFLAGVAERWTWNSGRWAGAASAPC